MLTPRKHSFLPRNSLVYVWFCQPGLTHSSVEIWLLPEYQTRPPRGLFRKKGWKPKQPRAPLHAVPAQLHRRMQLSKDPKGWACWDTGSELSDLNAGFTGVGAASAAISLSLPASRLPSKA